MAFADLFGRGARLSGGRAGTVERPASATASAEFWRAFLRQEARPRAPYQAPLEETPRAAARVKSAEAGAPSVEPEAIARELGLSRFASIRALQRLRRDFALKNHPDRVPSSLRARATKRMMIANALIDSAMKR